ncbi:hypothetical protein HID58_021554 [Brassica napus]|uniref:RNase H type-1 domain-containing protein n=1 Tax=Brassica napus TaxID=3708 RepID=A0ABQ8CWY9_BRANA|nr:hypothetical protein HID58_021554 [Brassica napus]
MRSFLYVHNISQIVVSRCLTSAFTTQRINFAALSSATSVLQGTWSLMSSLIKNDEKRLGLVAIELWTRQGNVGGWSACLNSTTAYPSDIPPGIEVKCSRTGVQGEFLYDQDTLVELSNQDSIHSSSLSSLSRTYATVSRSSLLNNMISGTVEIHLVSRIIIVSITAGLAYLMDCIAKSNFSRSIAKALIFTRQYIRGSTRQDSVRSPVVAEALTLQSGFITAENLELPTLKMLSDNSTFVRAINNDNQSKEIYVRTGSWA